MKSRSPGANTGFAVEDVPAVILAAGSGTRISGGNGGRPKPLTRFLGMTLLERAVLSCRAAGVETVYVVVGFARDDVAAHVERLAAKHDFDVRAIDNPWWEEGNGTSALAAAPYIDGPFFLMMADHLFDPAIISLLHEAPRDAETSLLAVDKRIRSVFDLDDATKVELDGDSLVSIDKELGAYDAIDTGIFLCDPALFSALRLARRRGEGSLSGGMRQLIQRGLASSVDIGDKFWIDVDTPESLTEARKRVLARMPKGSMDGPIARRLNRPVSRRVSAVLAHTPVTPNMISVFSFLLAIAGGLAFGVGGYEWPLIAGVLIQAASVIDGSDGEIARLKFRASPFGGWFDSVLDRYADLAIVAGITYGFWSVSPTPATWIAGLFAAVGFTMYSYSRKEYQVSHGEPLPERFPFVLIPASRDVRIFIVFLGALAGLAFPAMLLAGGLSHLAVVTRLFAGRPRKQRRTRVDPVVAAVAPSPETFPVPAEPERAPTFAD
jgi:CDP-L-myo-inositol myo-inositolphosphotransferase